MNVNNEHFCHYPWNGLDISSQGEFRPCCKYKNTVASTIDDYFNSSELEKLKKDFQSGIRPEGCKRCWDDEDAGVLSKRQIDKKYFTDDYGVLQILNLSFGNSCNLACRTCGSYASSSWIAQEENLSNHKLLTIYKHQKFYQDTYFMNKIKEISKEVKIVEFIGGETFIAGIKEHINFLDYLLEQNSSTISLRYITNGTTFPKDEFWNRWKKFNNVDLQVSLDGIQEHFEYTRWPGNWEICHDNIKKYIIKRDTESNINLSISHVVSIFTVYYLPEFLIWCLKNKLGKPYLSLLADPDYYNIKNLPVSVKDKIVKRLREYSFNDIVSYMMSENLKDFQTTADMIRLLDEQRNQKFSKTFPEFNQLLKEAKCQI